MKYWCIVADAITLQVDLIKPSMLYHEALKLKRELERVKTIKVLIQSDDCNINEVVDTLKKNILVNPFTNRKVVQNENIS